jgi:oligopeptide/dipeptide ABC transporter ATP-binding protein
MAAPLLEVQDLKTHIYTDIGTVRAVDGVTLHIDPGEAVALVGESGCGKSMTACSIMRLTRPPARTIEGRISFAGENLLDLGEDRMRRLRGDKLAMIFQDPMTFLNPVFRVGEQIAEALRIHQGLDRRTARAKAREALIRVRIPAPDNVLDYFPHQLSGGMRQRVLIAIAIACAPELLIADEPTTALDVTIQAQIMELLATIRRELGSAMLLITHDLGLVAAYCDRVYVMYAGEIVEAATVDELFADPRHPYTRALLRSTLDIDHRVEDFQTIEGQPPNLVRPPSGCRFHPRCAERFAPCATEAPPSFRFPDGREARCWLHGEQA